MYRDLGWVKTFTAICMTLALLTLPVMAIINLVIPMWHEVAATDDLYAGEIVDKKIINASSGLFSSSDMDYRLVIEGEFEYKGSIKEIEKSISVDKEIYQSAEIGDWFDSHSLEISEKE